MKYLLAVMALCCLTSCQAQKNTLGLAHMNPDLWDEDVHYLNKKIQNQFASFDPLIKKEFNRKVSVLREELPKLDNPTSAIKIGQLVASLGDGHTEMSILQKTADFRRLPIAMYFFEEGLYIVAAHKGYEQFIGKRVFQIGNRSVPELFEALKTVMTYDNDYEILHAGPTFLLLPEVLLFLKAIEDVSDIRFSMQTEDGALLDHQIIRPIDRNAYGQGPWVSLFDKENIGKPLRRKHRNQDYWFEYLAPHKTMYFNFSRNNNQKGHPSIKQVVSEMFREITALKAEKLVIDLRANRGGNYKKSRPLISAINNHPFINEKGKVYALIGRTTFSAAMVTAIFLKKETKTVLVGEPSRGHPNKTDNVEYMRLPNSNLEIEYTTKVKKHWPELKNAQHLPIDVSIPILFSDYKEGIDAALRHSLEH